MPARELVDLVVEAVDAGLAPVMLTEVDAAAATSVTAAAAALRPGARLGTAIVPLGSRSTAALAMEATTAAGLAGTEFLLGVGVSSPQIVGDWHGATHDPSIAATRARLIELRALLTGARRGSFGIREEAAGMVRILLGTLGPRMQELAHEVADGTIVNLTPPDDLASSAVGRRLVMVWTLCGPGSELRARRELVSYALSRPYAAHLERLGYGAVVQEVERLRAAGRLREAPSRLPDALLERLFTPLDALPRRLADYRAAGAEPLVLPVLGPESDADPGAAVRDLIRRS